MKDRINVIMLENEDTRYEFYLNGIHRSNIDDTIVRWELVYNWYHLLKSGLGSTCSYGNKFFSIKNKGIVTPVDFMIYLMNEGFEVVTHETKKFA